VIEYYWHHPKETPSLHLNHLILGLIRKENQLNIYKKVLTYIEATLVMSKVKRYRPLKEENPWIYIQAIWETVAVTLKTLQAIRSLIKNLKE
jgi:hypothetical protein